MVTQTFESEVFRIPKMTILPAPGSFAKVSGPYEGCWYNCREEFHWVNEKTRRFLYSHRLGTHARIVDFIEKIEKKLGLKAKDRTRFRRTQYGRVTLVVMSSWWRFSIRRSLFTALLRAGQNYNGENFEEALFSKNFGKDNHYLADTEGAVRRFLRGNTWYTGKVQGWWDAFEGSLVWDWQGRHTKDSLEKMLVKPKES
jgi:hypothetical protein